MPVILHVTPQDLPRLRRFWVEHWAGEEIIVHDKVIRPEQLEAVVNEARRQGCRRVFLSTTNDNLRALGFYQKRGFELVRILRGAVNDSRRIKPGIPLVGEKGIPLRDEIALELSLPGQ